MFVLEAISKTCIKNLCFNDGYAVSELTTVITATTVPKGVANDIPFFSVW